MPEPSAQQSLEGEHGVQFSLLKALRRAAASEPPTEFRQLLDQFIDFTDVHFLSENLMMRLYGFPDYALHSSEHEAFMDQMRALRERFEAGEAVDLAQEIDTQMQWLTSHLNQCDRELKRYLQELDA